MAKKAPGVLWVCVAEDGCRHDAHDRKKDVCILGMSWSGVQRECACKKDGCKPVKYVRGS